MKKIIFRSSGVRFYAPTANKILRALRANIILFAFCTGVIFYVPTTNAQCLNNHLLQPTPTPPAFDALYSFDGTTAGEDLSGNGHNLDIVGGVSFETTDAISGNALRFDGTGSLQNNDASFMSSQITNFTIGFWLKPDNYSNSNRQVLFEEGGAGQGISLSLESGTLKARFLNGSAADSLDVAYPGADENWHHVMLQKQGTTAFIYIDGAIAAQTTTHATIGTHQYESCVGSLYASFPEIGDATAVPNIAAYQGLMDEFFYSRNAIDGRNYRGSAYTGHNALYSFDGTTAGEDLSGTSYNLDVAGSVTFETTDVIAGKALYFDGTGSLQNNTAGFMSSEITDFTIAFWLKPDNYLDTDRQVLFEEGGATNGISLSLEAGILKARFLNGAVADSIDAPYEGADGEWHHIMLQKTGELAVLYVDAGIVGLTYTHAKISAHEQYNAIGTYYSGFSEKGLPANLANYKGLMDEFVYSRTSISNANNFLYNQCASPNPLQPLPCDHRVIQSNTILEAEGGGNRWFRINLITGDLDHINDETHYMATLCGINSIGYNMLDGFLYGTDHNGEAFSTIGGRFRTITGLNASGEFVTRYVALNNFGTVIGDVMDDMQYLRGPANSVYSYNVDPTSPDYFAEIGVQGVVPNAPTRSNGFHDWAISPNDKMIYMVCEVATDGTSNLFSFDPVTNTGTVVGTTYFNNPALHSGSHGFGAAYFDSDGYLYVLNNLTGTNWRIDIHGDYSQAAYVSNSAVSNMNDGARCPFAPMPVDFADAPDSTHSGNDAHYLTNLLDGGPRHFIPDYDGVNYSSKLMLGAKVDIDLDGITTNTDAHGDDLTGVTNDFNFVDDEDAIATPLILDQIATNYSINIGVTNLDTANACLMGWIDFNANGLFESSELAYSTVSTGLSAAAGDSITLVWNAPALQGNEYFSIYDDTTYLRLRITTDTAVYKEENSLSTGMAENGEVEDHIINFILPVADYGDAPESYGTLSKHNGAAHFPAADINDNTTGLAGSDGKPDLLLGANFDIETNGQPVAPGTDNNAPYGDGDDEDGITNLPKTSKFASSYQTQLIVNNVTGQKAYISAWLDFNRDSIFTSNERITTSNYGTTADSTLTLQWSGINFIPKDSIDAGNNNPAAGFNYMRIRVSSDSLSIVEPTGIAPDGEVEDYRIEALENHDFGDAPDSYCTRWPSGGAIHLFPNPSENIYIGAVPPDNEADGQPSANADGDDNDGTDDEDGLPIKIHFYQNGSIALKNISVVNNTGKPGYLYAWIDGNQDDTFENTTERVKVDIPTGFNGTTSLLFNNFSTAPTTGNHFVRLRVGTVETEVSQPTSLANDGEVEDHMIYILTLDSLSRMMKKDATLNNVQHNGFSGNPVSVLFNEHITYEITAVNADYASGEVVVVDTLPYYLNYVPGTISTGGVRTATAGSPARDIITWTLNNVASMADTIVSVKATPESGACATQPLFFNKAWVTIKATDTITVQTGNMTHHQGAGVSIITFSASFGGEIFNAREQALDYKTAPSGNILIVPDEGYQFAGWSHQEYRSLRGELIEAQSDIMHYDTLIVHGRVELRAEFAPEEYPISYFLNHADNHELNPPEYTILSDSIRIHAPSKRDDEFLGWTTGDTSELPVKDFCIPKGSTGEVRLYAHFLHTGREKEDDEKDTADNLWSENGFLFIETVAPQSDIRIYSTDGKLHQMRNNVTPGLTKINLAHGVYIVTINGNAGRKILMR